jgi:hypothetical protein
LGNKKSIWEDPSREVAQIFDGTTVKARPRKRNTDVEGIGRARTSVRGTTNQAAGSLEPEEKDLGRRNPGIPGTGHSLAGLSGLGVCERKQGINRSTRDML